MRLTRDLLLLYLAIITDSIASNVLTPFAPDFIKEGLGLPSEKAGLYAGLMIGLFSFAVAISAPLLGALSDRYGRKRLLVLGLLSSTVFTFFTYAFPVAGLAFALRFLTGLFDATQTIAYASIGDLFKGPERAIAFGYSAASFQIARILSSVIGGYTVDIDVNVASQSDNDFLLPALIGSGLCLIALGFVARYFRESNPRFRFDGGVSEPMTGPVFEPVKEVSQSPSFSESSTLSSTCHTDSPPPPGSISLVVLSSDPARTAPVNSNEQTDHSLVSSDSSDQVSPTFAGPLASDVQMTRSDCPTPPCLGSNPLMISPHPPPEITCTSLFGDWRMIQQTPYLLQVILAYSIINFANGALLVLIPLIVLQSTALNGFGGTASVVANLMLAFAAWAVVFQFLFYPRLLARFGLKRVNSFGSIILIACSAIFPFAGAAAESAIGLSWVLSGIAVMLMGSGFMLCASLLSAMISNLTPAGKQGAVQGCSRAAASLARASGPFLFGYLFDVSSTTFVTFFLCGALYLCCNFVMYSVPAEAVDSPVGDREEQGCSQDPQHKSDNR